MDELFFNFLWGKDKRPKVKKETIIKDVARGGIKMIDVKSMMTAMKAPWIKRLLTNVDDTVFEEKWKNLTLFMAGISDKNILLHKLSQSQFPKSQSKFYDSVISCWYKFFAVGPGSVHEIFSEKIVRNKFITIGGLPVEPTLNVIKATGISRVGQLYHGSHIKSKQMLEEEYGGPFVDLQYYSLVSAIPKEWKDKTKKTEGKRTF